MAIVFLMEFVYLKDYMGDAYYQMDSVFKFGFCAWFMLGTSALLIIGRWVQDRWREISGAQELVVAVVIFVVLAALFGGSAGFISDIREGTMTARHGHESYHPACRGRNYIH